MIFKKSLFHASAAWHRDTASTSVHAPIGLRIDPPEYRTHVKNLSRTLLGPPCEVTLETSKDRIGHGLQQRFQNALEQSTLDDETMVWVQLHVDGLLPFGNSAKARWLILG